jgi:asparagine synthase (glutamine-hydrolysing)
MLPVGFKGRNWLKAVSADFEQEVPHVAELFDQKTRKKLFHRFGPTDQIVEDIFKRRTPKQSDLIQRATRMDFANYLAEDILVKVDRASMLHSLEVRAPFLDYRLIEFAYGRVPSFLKATHVDRKILLKRLTERLLPKNFDRKRKQGFSIPISKWLKKGKFRNMFQDILFSSDCAFDLDTVTRLMSGQDKGRNNGERLFALVMFEMWRKEYEIHL